MTSITKAEKYKINSSSNLISPNKTKDLLLPKDKKSAGIFPMNNNSNNRSIANAIPNTASNSFRQKEMNLKFRTGKNSRNIAFLNKSK